MRIWALLVVGAFALSVAADAARALEPDDLAQDRKLIQGTWVAIAYDLDGNELPPEMLKKLSLTIQADRFTIGPKVAAQRTGMLKEGGKRSDVKFTLVEDQTDEATYQLDIAKKRKVIELTRTVGGGQTSKMVGLYALQEDRLTICIPLPDRKLPKQMPAAPAAGMVRLSFKRALLPPMPQPD